jgi:hypothetical protein
LIAKVPAWKVMSCDLSQLKRLLRDHGIDIERPYRQLAELGLDNRPTDGDYYYYEQTEGRKCSGQS